MNPFKKKEFWLRFFENLYKPILDELKLTEKLPDDDFRGILYYTVVWMLLGILVIYQVPIPLLNRFKILNKNQQLVVRNRLAAILYGQIVFWHSAYLFVSYIITKYRCGHLSRCLCQSPNTSQELFILRFASAYLLYDLFSLTSSGLITLPTVLHHLTCLLAFYITMCKQTNACYIIMALFLVECTNFWRQLRKILIEIGMKHTRLTETVY